MSSNLFEALRRYAPGPKRNPAEDYLTEAFAWLLNQHEGLGRNLAQRVVGERQLNEAPFEWRTQVHLGTGNGRVDMVGEGGGVVLICEHKIDAQLGKHQLRKYERAAKERWPGKVFTALITRSKAQHTEEASAALTWAQVYEFVEDWNRDRDDAVVRDFLAYLMGQGLSPAPQVTAQALAAYKPAQTLLPALEALFANLAEELRPEDFEALYRAMRQPDLSARPTYQKLKWGRIGVAFPSVGPWRPGVFAGVLVDGTDHRVSWVQEEKGPDFVLLVSFHLDAGKPSWDDYVMSPEFERLRKRLTGEAQAAGFDFHDHLREPRPNRWHPVHLRRPLVNVLGGAKDAEEQRERVAKVIGAGVEVLLAGGELQELAGRWPVVLSSASTT